MRTFIFLLFVLTYCAVDSAAFSVPYDSEEPSFSSDFNNAAVAISKWDGRTSERKKDCHGALTPPVAELSTDYSSFFSLALRAPLRRSDSATQARAPPCF